MIVLAVQLVSCNENDDASRPVITLDQPAQSSEYDVPDTVFVKGIAEDDQAIRSLYVTITDQYENEMVQRKTYLPDANRFVFETYFELTDKNLETGFYNVKVTADDGTNSTNQYQPIYIVELPERMTGYFAVTGQLGITSTIYKLDPDFNQDTIVTIPEACLMTALNSNWEQFFFISDEPSVLTSYEISSMEPAWEVEDSPPRPVISDIIGGPDLMFSSENGDISILDINGNTRIKTVPYQDKKITSLAADDLYIYAAHVSLTGSINELTTYYLITGQVREQKLLSAPVSSIVATGGEAIIFLDSGPDVPVMLYDPETLEISQLTLIPGEELISAEKISDEEIFLLTENRVITFDPVSLNYSSFSPEPYEICRYDPISDDVYLVKDNFVYRYKRSTGDLIRNKQFQDDIIDFQILYNK